MKVDRKQRELAKDAIAGNADCRRILRAIFWDTTFKTPKEAGL